MSSVIDSQAGMRALLNNVIRDVYRRKANDKKHYHDVVTKHTVAIAASSGSVPTNIMREFLPQAQFQDSNNSLIAWTPYAVDYSSGVNYTQIGYVTVVGDAFSYRAPAPNQSFTGNLFVTVQTFPTITTTWSADIAMTQTTTDDVVIALSQALLGKYEFLA